MCAFEELSEVSTCSCSMVWRGALVGVKVSVDQVCCRSADLKVEEPARVIEHDTSAHMISKPLGCPAVMVGLRSPNGAVGGFSPGIGAFNVR